MEAVVTKNRKLDFSKIVFSGRTITSEHALKDVNRINWCEDVKRGEKKVSVFSPHDKK